MEKHIRFLLQQPGIQDAITFPKHAMVVYDYLDEFRYLSWSSFCTGETSIQLKIVEPNNLLILVLKIGKSEKKQSLNIQLQLLGVKCAEPVSFITQLLCAT